MEVVQEAFGFFFRKTLVNVTSLFSEIPTKGRPGRDELRSASHLRATSVVLVVLGLSGSAEGKPGPA